jgi:DNA-binding CsgD family transcriptional regulator
VPCAILIYDRNGVVIDANDFAAGMLGLDRENVLGGLASDQDWLVVGSPAGPLSEHPVAAALNSQTAERGYVLRVRRAGLANAWLLCDAVPRDETVALTMMDVTQLYEGALKRLDRLASLRNIGLAVSTSSDLRLTLKLILDQALARLAVDAADVLIVDETGTNLSTAQTAGFRAAIGADYTVPLAEAVPAGSTARRVETIAALGGHFRRRTLFTRERFKAYGAVPLVAHDKLLGLLEIFHRTPLDPDEEWLSFLDALGSEAAIAIDNAAIHDQLRRGGAHSLNAVQNDAPDLNGLELRILQLVAEGKTNPEIGVAVHLSPSTVKFHVRQMLEKTGAANRVDLTRMATRGGWV